MTKGSSTNQFVLPSFTNSNDWCGVNSFTLLSSDGTDTSYQKLQNPVLEGGNWVVKPVSPDVDDVTYTFRVQAKDQVPNTLDSTNVYTLHVGCPSAAASDISLTVPQQSFMITSGKTDLSFTYDLS